MQPRRGGMQAVRPRFGVLRGRLARVLPRLRDHPPQTALPRRGALPSHRADLRQKSRQCCRGWTACCCISAAGVRWDSDHVAILSDELRERSPRNSCAESTWGACISGLDFFDASINRVAAWVIGARAVQKALLLALLEPVQQLRRLERSGDFTGRLALLERLRMLPYGAVWRPLLRHQRRRPGSGLAAGSPRLRSEGTEPARRLAQAGTGSYAERGGSDGDRTGSRLPVRVRPGAGTRRSRLLGAGPLCRPPMPASTWPQREFVIGRHVRQLGRERPRHLRRAGRRQPAGCVDLDLGVRSHSDRHAPDAVLVPAQDRRAAPEHDSTAWSTPACTRSWPAA